MSWLCSRALVAEFSGASSSGGGASAPSKSNPIAGEFFVIDRTTEPSSRSRFGTMSERLTGDRGADVLTSFLAGFPVRTLAQRERGRESAESDPDCGPKWRGLSVKFNRDSSSWKTHLCLFPEVLEWSSVTFPKWGMMRDGELWERITSALPTSRIGSGFWQTPVADDSVNRKQGKFNSRGEPKLSAQVKLWRTPKASDGQRGPTRKEESMRRRMEKGNTLNLSDQVHHEWLWPTPTCMDAAGFCGKPDKGRTGPNSGRTLTGKALEMAGKGPHAEKFPTPRSTDACTMTQATESTARRVKNGRARLDEHISNQAGRGTLNPNWVEWLMGWPIGHTDSKPLETDKFRLWLRQHGAF